MNQPIKSVLFFLKPNAFDKFAFNSVFVELSIYTELLFQTTCSCVISCKIWRTRSPEMPMVFSLLDLQKHYHAFSEYDL